MGFFKLELHDDFHFTEEIVKIYDSRNELNDFDIAFPKRKSCSPPYISGAKICRNCYYKQFSELIRDLRKSKRKEFLKYQLELRNDKLGWLDELDVLFLDYEDQFDNIDLSFAYEYKEIIEELRKEISENDSNSSIENGEFATVDNSENGLQNAPRRKSKNTKKFILRISGAILFTLAVIGGINDSFGIFDRIKQAKSKNEPSIIRLTFADSLWVKFRDSMINQKIDFLIENSFDTIQCIDCVNDDLKTVNEQYASRFIFENNLAQLIHLDNIGAYDFSSNQSDSVIYITYSIKLNDAEEGAYGLHYKFKKAREKYLFQGMFTTP